MNIETGYREMLDAEKQDPASRDQHHAVGVASPALVLRSSKSKAGSLRLKLVGLRRSFPGLVITLVIILALAGQVPAGETLPALKNGQAPQTLEEVWGDYDPRAEPMKVETHKEWKEEGVVIRAMRYYIGTFKGKEAWMAGLYAFPEGGRKLPAILESHGGGGWAFSKTCIEFARRGYAIFSISWRVEPKYLKDYSLPPEAQTDWGGVTGDQTGAARGIRPSGDLNLDPVPSARNEGYFLRTLAARRGITFLEQQPEVNPDKIGMTGHSMGGTICHQTAAMEPVRLKAVAPSDGPPIVCTYKDRTNQAETTEEDRRIEELANRTAVPDVYCKNITVPMLFLNSVNDFHGHVEAVEWIIDNMPAEDYRLARTPRVSHWHNPAAYAVKFLWFDAYLKGNFDFPERPAIKVDLKTAGRMPIASVTPDPSIDLPVDSVDFYYTRDGNNNYFGGFQSRMWGYVKGVKEGGSYNATIPVSELEQPLWIYANVNYTLPEDNDHYKLPEASKTLMCSTRMPMIRYEDLKAAEVNFLPLKRTMVVDDFGSNWRKDWTLAWRRGYFSHKLLAPNLHVPRFGKLVFKITSKDRNSGYMEVGIYNTRFNLEPGENILEFFPFKFSERRNKTKFTEWSALLSDRPQMSFSINEGIDYQPHELAFVELTEEEVNARRPDYEF